MLSVLYNGWVGGGGKSELCLLRTGRGLSKLVTTAEMPTQQSQLHGCGLLGNSHQVAASPKQVKVLKSHSWQLRIMVRAHDCANAQTVVVYLLV